MTFTTATVPLPPSFQVLQAWHGPVWPGTGPNPMSGARVALDQAHAPHWIGPQPCSGMSLGIRSSGPALGLTGWAPLFYTPAHLLVVCFSLASIFLCYFVEILWLAYILLPFQTLSYFLKFLFPLLTSWLGFSAFYWKCRSSYSVNTEIGIELVSFHLLGLFLLWPLMESEFS